MDREILFKGFHEREEGSENAFFNGEWHKGEWLYGYFFKHPNKNCCILCENEYAYDVAPETVCQYTGRDDMYGKKIFENDICDNGRYISTVEYGWACGNVFGFMCKNLYESSLLLKNIGNKFENPELLEVEENENN